MNRFPIPEIEHMTKTTRKIGLGIMGFADLLFQLEIAYDSDEALELAEKIMLRISDKSHTVSQTIGKKRGSFPAFKGSIWDLPDGKAGKKNYKTMRNATTTTIAPTAVPSRSSGAPIMPEAPPITATVPNMVTCRASIPSSGCTRA